MSITATSESEADIRFPGDGLPQKSRTYATYHGSQEDWERLAVALDRPGGRRVANAIREGVRRRRHSHFGYIPLRFVDGSIDVIDEVLRAFWAEEFATGETS